MFTELNVPNNSDVDEWDTHVIQVQDTLLAVYYCALPGCFDWNGTTRGQPVPAGTYAYLIRVKTGNGKNQDVRGQVNLVR